MAGRQFTSPLILQNGSAHPLHRVAFEDRRMNESTLQELLFDHPELLPTRSIEPIFDELIPVCRELPTTAGSLDLLYMTSGGSLVLTETKLWRNPEARRSVLAQIIDYAKDMARWSYTDLVNAVRKVRPDLVADPLVELARDAAEDFDESDFHDQIARNLQLGRFLLLIVGDGIREDIEQMADFLQQTPQLSYTIGLVEIGLYRISDDQPEPLFVQPRIVARTQEVTRAVVEIRNRAGEDVEVDVRLPAVDTPTRSERTKMTESRFLEGLARHQGEEVVEFARWALQEAEQQGWRIEWAEAGPVVKCDDIDSGEYVTLFQLYFDGRLTEMRRYQRRCYKLGLPDRIWVQYLDDVAGLVPGAERRKFATKKGEYHDVATGPRPFNDAIRLKQIAERKEQWMDVVRDAASRFIDAINEKAGGD